MPTPRRATGDAGEAVAARWYEARGYVVVDRNWRCREGELDLIVRGPAAAILGGPAVLVFCEVKTRRSTRYGEPFEAVTVAKQQRIRGLALRWLAEHPDARAAELRFDVASVRVDAAGDAAVAVIEAAF